MKHFIMSAIRIESGFTLLEMLIALVIGGLLVTGTTVFIGRIFSENTRSSGNMQAIQQVENAGYWVSKDVQMSQTVTPGANAGFPLQLTWTNWNGDVNKVTFTITGNHLERSLRVNNGTPTQTLVAQSINTNSTLTQCSYANSTLTFTVTATVGKESETRTYQIKNRPG